LEALRAGWGIKSRSRIAIEHSEFQNLQRFQPVDNPAHPDVAEGQSDLVRNDGANLLPTPVPVERPRRFWYYEPALFHIT
jgi:hypothetical protein